MRCPSSEAAAARYHQLAGRGASRHHRGRPGRCHPASSRAPRRRTAAPCASGRSVATASSEYGSDSWSASQATGAPDVTAYADDGNAWAPQAPTEPRTGSSSAYPQAVVPSEVGIVGDVRQRGRRQGGACTTRRLTLGRSCGPGTDPTSPAIATFHPALAAVPFPTDRVRDHPGGCGARLERDRCGGARRHGPLIGAASAVRLRSAHKEAPWPFDSSTSMSSRSTSMRFLEVTRRNHEGSVAEPGNVRFDVLRSADDPTPLPAL